MAKNKGTAQSAAIAVLVALLVCIVALFGYKYIRNDIDGRSGDSTPVIITLGDNAYSVSQSLYHNGIIINDALWTSWMSKHYPSHEYIPGDYELRANMSYGEIAQALINPLASHELVRVCIPEGYDVFAIANAMEENSVCSSADFLEACKDKSKYDYSFIANIPDSDMIAYALEGFLFPATYDLSQNMEPENVIDQMLRAFADRISPEWREYCTVNNMSLYELVTLASIVEKETLGSGNAERIASVFVNRLDISQQLQSDVTIDYGNKLREAGIEDKIVFSYNTYKCSALPSGPICNPGVENINAVVHHADTNYLYFFSYNNGADFYFTDSFNDFQAQWDSLKHTNTN